jgi:hypothetical protein
MLRKLSIGVATLALLGLSGVPAFAATGSRPVIHHFGIPGATGVSAWGSYYKTSRSVRVTLCVKETSRATDIAQATGVALNSSGRRHQAVSAQVLGIKTGKQVCRTMTTKDTAHLYVQVFSGTTNGHAHVGKLKKVY